MAVNVMVEDAGDVVESEERWRPIPYILTLEDVRNLRAAARDKQLSTRLAKWKKLQPLFTPEVWQQVLGHIEGMEG